MSRLAEMRNLTEDLSRSYDARVAALSALQADVQGAMQATRGEMAACRDARLEMAAALRQDMAEDRVTMQAAVADTLANFSRARAEMAASQRLALSKTTSDRHAEVRTMRAGTQRAIGMVHTSRLADEAALAARLRQDRADLFQQIIRSMANISMARAGMAADQRESLNQGRAELAADAANFLSDTFSGRQALAKAQRDALQAGRAKLDANVSAALGGFHDAREALAGNLVELKQIWQDFSGGMQARRSSTGPGLAAEPVAQPVAEQAAPPEVAEEASEYVAPEPAKLPSDEVVFSYLADHPDGLRLTDMEAHFGLPRIRLAQIVNRLIEENKARKDDEHKLYFAT